MSMITIVMQAVSDVFRLSLHLFLVAMSRLMNNEDELFWVLGTGVGYNCSVMR